MTPRETWRLLTTWDGEPGWNMALDEALLLSRDPRPTLRFYTWKPAALSLGYFQRWSELELLARDTAAVRRQTGGGAIHHAEELTFSIACPLEHPLYRGDVRSSYERVHALLAAALARHGVQASLRGATPLGSDRAASAMCFHRSTALDLSWDGAKGVGSAQRRTRGRVLHHGSIKLGKSALEPGIATLRERAPGLDAPTLAGTIRQVVSESLAVDLAPEEPAPAELEHARRRASSFASETFLRRR